MSSTNPNNRELQNIKDRKWHTCILAIMGVLTVVSMLTCSYGHAALSQDLLISGEAGIMAGEPFDGYMQDFTLAQCQAMEEDIESLQLKDRRDGNIYQVTKFRDGNCWMTENLALTAPEEGLLLTANDSDVEEDWEMPASKTASINNWASTYGAVQSINAKSLNINYGQYGTYYSFSAATAGTGTNTVSYDGEHANSSICPKGWKLPIAGNASGYYNNTSGSFYYLAKQYGATTNNAAAANILRGKPLNFIFSGNIGASGVPGGQNNSGFGIYWSRTGRKSGTTITQAYSLKVAGSSVATSDAAPRYTGLAVRCLHPSNDTKADVYGEE